jgi:hypothetical protein
MTAPYDYEALWLKAKVFINRAMDPSTLRSFDEQAFWASAALELLGKAALAKVSPLLIADPQEEGRNLLIAAGLVEGDARFKSVTAKTIFWRCERAFKPFRLDDALKMAAFRNEYLHSASLDLLPHSPDVWWPVFWARAVVLITAMDRTLEDLVGADRVSISEAHLEKNAANVKERLEALIARAIQRLDQYRSGALPERELSAWTSPQNFVVGMNYCEYASCPACTAEGLLEGDEEVSTEIRREGIDSDDEWSMPWNEVTVLSEYFSCPVCHLVLDRPELIGEAGLPEEFIIQEDYDPGDYEPEYGND